MAITAVHALLYSTHAEELRTVLRDIFGWSHVDAGEGWLIFALPPAELGVHPGDHAAHELSFICDDIVATMAELRSKGIQFESEPRDQGFGIASTMVLPGEVKVMLYQPRHPIAASG